MKFIDSHTHLDHKRFDDNRNAIIEMSHEAGIEYMINPAIDFSSNYTMRECLDPYEFIRYGVGIHPNYLGTDWMTDEERMSGLTELLIKNKSSKRIVAIGETGLDYYRLTRDKNGEPDENGLTKLRRQHYWFRKHLYLACRTKLPLILHIRNADIQIAGGKCRLTEETKTEYVDAHKEAIRILKEFDKKLPSRKKGVIHCFSSKDIEDAFTYIDMGYMLGIGGAITYEGLPELKEIVKQVPLQNIVLETDCPYVFPTGMNRDIAGKRNTPVSIPYIAQKLAEVKGIRLEDVAQITRENALQLFRLD
ncbi:MAG: TatD family hydrolase [Clostridiales bacterium]|nr:TatD family hydrolase [Clostridiales bacterium]